MDGTCNGCRGSNVLQQFQLGPIQSNQIWPQLADAIAVCVDDLKGTTITPKCAHLAGFGAPLSGDSMLTCLQNSGFRPSGGRALSTVSSRVAACVQPTKRLAPTILLEGLGPASHLAVTLQTEHPFSRPPQMDLHVESAITLQPDPHALRSRRSRCCDIMSRLCEALNAEWQAWLPYIHRDIRPIVGRRHVPFCREVSFVSKFIDITLWADYVCG